MVGWVPGPVVVVLKGKSMKHAISEADPVVISYSLISALDGFLLMEECGDFSYHGYKLDDVAEKFLKYFCHGFFTT